MTTILSYKIRIYPTYKQKKIINKTLDACRFIYNDYLAMTIEYYKSSKDFITGYDYSKMLTSWKKTNARYMWLNNISSKAIHETFMDCDSAYKKFFKKEGKFPRFKSKKRNPITGYYFIGDKVKFKPSIKRVNLPILGLTKISECFYVPTNKRVIGGTIKKEGDKYYAVFRIEEDSFDILYRKEDRNNKSLFNIFNTEYYLNKKYSPGIGIDMGIKTFLTGYTKDGNLIYQQSFLKDKRIIKLEKRITRLQRIISNKMEVNLSKMIDEYKTNHNGEEPSESYRNQLQSKSYSNSCRCVQKKINRCKNKISNIKTDIINKLVLTLVRTKPKYITIEDLSIKGLLENDASHTLHKSIQDSKIRLFFNKLIENARYYGIEIRKANRFFASSKKCSNCGKKNKKLTLNDREFICPHCNLLIDRDVNAAINLCKLTKYDIVI